jgi:hypothetical protein
LGRAEFTEFGAEFTEFTESHFVLNSVGMSESEFGAEFTEFPESGLVLNSWCCLNQNFRDLQNFRNNVLVCNALG